MNRTWLTILMIFTCMGLMATTDSSTDGEKIEQALIKKVVSRAYVDGLLNGQDLEETRKGFHPDFKLPILNQNRKGLNWLPISNWIQYTEKQKSEKPDSFRKRYIGEFKSIDVSGSAAMVKLALYRAGKLIYTDFLSLYRFKGGWKIVGKIFFQHQKP